MTHTDEVKAAYDELASTYESVAESDPCNALLEFPATTGLLPDVSGHRVLDAGCGAGRYVEYLLENDADVVGVDVSEAMIEQTRERVGDAVDLHQADLTEPLTFASENEFDGVVSSLTFDYIREWGPVLAEFSRIIEPGGFLVISIRHPVSTYERAGDSSTYAAIETVEPDYEVGVPYFRRPIAEIFNPIVDSGFDIAAVSEPQPTEEFRDHLPGDAEVTIRDPVYLCIRARLAEHSHLSEEAPGSNK